MIRAEIALTAARDARLAGCTMISMGTGNWHAKREQSLTRGQRAADALRNGMGSWPFIGAFLSAMLVWAVLNSFLLVRAWDPYPYILLNLLLSMVAGLQGAILLIAAKRQDAIAAAMAQHDYDTDLAAKVEIERLIALSQQQSRMLAELQASVLRWQGAADAPPA